MGVQKVCGYGDGGIPGCGWVGMVGSRGWVGKGGGV